MSPNSDISESRVRVPRFQNAPKDPILAEISHLYKCLITLSSFDAVDDVTLSVALVLANETISQGGTEFSAVKNRLYPIFSQ